MLIASLGLRGAPRAYATRPGLRDRIESWRRYRAQQQTRAAR